MKLNTKEQHLRDQLGLIIPYTKDEIKILKTKHIEIIDESVAYKVSEWCVFKDTKQTIIGTWEAL